MGILYAADALSSEALSQSLNQYLREEPAESFQAGEARQYILSQFSSEDDFLQFIKQSKLPIDCLIFQEGETLQSFFNQLQEQAIFFPAIILSSTLQPVAGLLQTTPSSKAVPAKFSYHSAALELSITQLSQIRLAIEQAISRFIELPPLNDANASVVPEVPVQTHQNLVAQQQRLAEKLKERLGYLGIYYKRNPQNFLRHMGSTQKENLLNQLKADYREIILTYFSQTAALNQRIDSFVNIVFLADIPVSLIVEIHMNLMDEFSTQLKLEGRSDEVLQDYRLTLIDTIAHLCEMYRRSIPRET
ncbi:circadian clock protein KaiA [Phormidium tenue FACHB-886]|nr:circadian clock protein KaiA [Phormidium tenue FACHB-886]